MHEQFKMESLTLQLQKWEFKWILLWFTTNKYILYLIQSKKLKKYIKGYHLSLKLNFSHTSNWTDNIIFMLADVTQQRDI